MCVKHISVSVPFWPSYKGARTNFALSLRPRTYTKPLSRPIWVGDCLPLASSWLASQLFRTSCAKDNSIWLNLSLSLSLCLWRCSARLPEINCTFCATLDKCNAIKCDKVRNRIELSLSCSLSSSSSCPQLYLVQKIKGRKAARRTAPRTGQRRDMRTG